MKNKLLIPILSFASLVLPVSVQADGIEKIFDTLTMSADAPTVANGRHGNTVNLGSVRIRPQMYNAKNIFEFAPPSLKTNGCGAIDFFAGSFSVISKDELVQMGRAVAQGVPSYAFNLAIDSICPECGDAMKALTAKLEKFNKMSMDGCKAAQNIIGDEPGWAKSIGESTNWLATPLNTVNGFLDDFGDGMTKNDEAGDDQLAEAGLTEEANVEGNAIWNAIQRTKAHIKLSDATGITETKAANLYLNIFGSLSQVYTEKAARDADTSGTSKHYQAGMLTLEHFARGFTRGADSDGELIRCDITVDPKCLSPIPADDDYFGDFLKDGFIKHVHTTLYNPAGAAGEKGIFMKIADRSLCPTVAPGVTPTGGCTPVDMLYLSRFDVQYLIEYITRMTEKNEAAIVTHHGSTLDSLASLIAHDIVLGMIEEIQQELDRFVKDAKGSKIEEQGGMKALIKEFSEHVTSVSKLNQKELNKLDEEVKEKIKPVQVELNNLNRVIVSRYYARKAKITGL